MHKIIYVLVVCFGIFVSGCTSTKHMIKVSSSPAELSSQLGFPIGKKDDIRLYDEAASWLGVPYLYAGNGRTGMDCSGLVGVIYKNVYHIKLDRTCESIYKNNCRPISRRKLKPGDLVFFNTTGKRKSISHVGVYLKDDIFIHATTSKGVQVSNMNEKYYKRRWIKGGKVILDSPL